MRISDWRSDVCSSDLFVLEKHGYVGRAIAGTVNYPEKITPGVLGAYMAPFPTPESRRALLCWSRDIPVDEGDPSWDDMAAIEKKIVRASCRVCVCQYV